MKPLLLSYIDPGTGSFLLQMLIAGTVGAIAYFRKAVFGIFHRGKPAEPAPKAPPPPPAPVPAKGEKLKC